MSAIRVALALSVAAVDTVIVLAAVALLLWALGVEVSPGYMNRAALPVLALYGLLAILTYAVLGRGRW